MNLRLLVILILIIFAHGQLLGQKKNKFSFQPSITKSSQSTVINVEDIGRYINQIRTAPSMLIPLLEERLQNGRAKNIQQWHEAIQYVERLQKMPTYNYSIVLERATLDHIQQLTTKNIITHVGNNGSSLVQRIQKYTNWTKGTTSQALIYQPNIPDRNHPLQILISLIVNQGMPSKAYRNAFFNQQFRYYGVSVRMNGNNVYAVFLFSTELFDLDYPDGQFKQQKGIKNKIGNKNQPVINFDFTKPNLMHKQQNQMINPFGFPLNNHLNGMKGGFNFGKQPHYSKESDKQRNVISATVQNGKLTKTYEDGRKQTSNK